MRPPGRAFGEPYRSAFADVRQETRAFRRTSEWEGQALRGQPARPPNSNGPTQNDLVRYAGTPRRQLRLFDRFARRKLRPIPARRQEQVSPAAGLCQTDIRDSQPFGDRAGRLGPDEIEQFLTGKRVRHAMLPTKDRFCRSRFDAERESPRRGGQYSGWHRPRRPVFPKGSQRR